MEACADLVLANKASCKSGYFYHGIHVNGKTYCKCCTVDAEKTTNEDFKVPTVISTGTTWQNMFLMYKAPGCTKESVTIKEIGAKITFEATKLGSGVLKSP